MRASICQDRLTELIYLTANVRTQWFKAEIIQPHRIRVIDRQKDLFHQDNAWLHKVSLAINHLVQNNINILIKPFKSPDLNPIEHLQD